MGFQNFQNKSFYIVPVSQSNLQNSRKGQGAAPLALGDHCPLHIWKIHEPTQSIQIIEVSGVTGLVVSGMCLFPSPSQPSNNIYLGPTVSGSSLTQSLCVILKFVPISLVLPGWSYTATIGLATGKTSPAHTCPQQSQTPSAEQKIAPKNWSLSCLSSEDFKNPYKTTPMSK